ncbi:MAG: hypothetical protein HPY67_15670 [Syntrophaceae bacterium]|nr:hypothetical protein [Syntrophaceae bacterium]
MDFKYLQEFFWPAVKDLESAKKAAEQGFLAAVLYLILSFGAVLTSQPQKLLDVVVVAICGYLAKRKQSRFAAVIGALMMAPEVLFSLQGGDLLRILTAGILLLLFVNAVRGTFMYQRFAKAGPPQPTVEIIPPGPADGPREQTDDVQKGAGGKGAGPGRDPNG